DVGADVHPAVHEVALPFGQIDVGGLEDAVRVGIDLYGRAAFTGLDREARVFEHLVIGRIGDVLADGRAIVRAPVRRVVHLDRAGEQRARARRPCGVGQGNAFGRGDLVAAVEVDDGLGRRRRDVVVQDDDGAGVDEVGRDAGRETVRRVAVTPDLRP